VKRRFQNQRVMWGSPLAGAVRARASAVAPLWRDRSALAHDDDYRLQAGSYSRRLQT